MMLPGWWNGRHNGLKIRRRKACGFDPRSGHSESMDTLLKHYTTFRLGGPCRELATAHDPDEAIRILECWSAGSRPWLPLGGGSNLLVSDSGLPDHSILRLAPGPEPVAISSDGLIWAGTPLDALAATACAAGLSGLEDFSGIPGTLGGSVCGNAGAFGKSLSDVVTAVDLWTPSRGLHTLPASALDFAYRSSALQYPPLFPCAVLRVHLRLTPVPSPAPLLVRRAEILALRASKHPDTAQVGTAGSYFKNLPPATPGGRRQPAGALLDAIGAKTLRVGGAYVFPKHANILVTDPATATAADVHALADLLASAVLARFDVPLVPEVRAWPP